MSSRMSEEEFDALREKQKNLADSNLDSAYSKLLSPDVTTEAMQQIMLEASSISDKGNTFLKGHLTLRITENFLNGKEITSQQYYKALEILENLKGVADVLIFNEYTEEKVWSGSASIAGHITSCFINMAVRKFKQECPNSSEFFRILTELKLRESY